MAAKSSPRPRSRHPVNVEIYDNATAGERIADGVTGFLGSWLFLVLQTIVVFVWLIGNAWLLSRPFDPFPFILLNLAFSTQAAYAAPLILLAGNRQQKRDRLTLEHTAEQSDVEEKQNEQLLTSGRRILEHVDALEHRILELEQNILAAMREGSQP